MFGEYLLAAKTNHIPISIYTDKADTRKFSFGFIQEYSKEYVLINSITPYGLYDGYIILKREEIYRIEKEDCYGKKLHRLYSLQNQSHKLVLKKTDSWLLNLLYFANASRLAISVELLSSEYNDLQGYVLGVEEDRVIIEQLDGYGNKDGYSVVALNDITFVYCDSDKEIALKLLSQNPLS